MLSNQVLANALRFLSIDAVEKANSGHPGMPLGMADIAQVLWGHYLKHNPKNPHWMNRDRFVLSNGHGSMLLYALLHLTGYDLSIEDIKQFRQIESKTPGHPEYGMTPGVETTTGPLGQGLANAVGFALAEKLLSLSFNKPDYPIIDHHTYVFVGDGCLMEGISHEVASLAGTWGLGKLIVFWDDNGISIDGKVTGWWKDNTPKRFESYGWEVINHVDGHNFQSIDQAIKKAISQQIKPTLICCKTTIGYGSPRFSGKASSHGSPMGKEEVEAIRKSLNWPYPAFYIPKPIYHAWNALKQGEKKEKEWKKLFDDYGEKFSKEAKHLKERFSTEVLFKGIEPSYQTWIKQIQKKAKAVATRKASLHSLNFLGPKLPALLGGSADLTGSNGTLWEGAKLVTLQNNTIQNGQYLHYGIREFGMFAIMNGLALYGGFIPYGGTFLVFSDYGRNAIRLAALMKQQVIFILTHDSIGLGEDGPTHQPVEHLSMLRMTPDLLLWRPCDAVETAIAWKLALKNQGPTCLALSRQALPVQSRQEDSLQLIEKGGYILHEFGNVNKGLDCLLIATGSEVELAVKAATYLSKTYQVRVVSMPCAELFLKQPLAYQEKVLPNNASIVRIAIEAGSSNYWYRFVGLQGTVIGLDTFGVSAPLKEAFESKGFTTDNIIKTVKAQLVKNN